MTFSCFSCGFQSDTPIHYPCQQCGQGVDHLDGTNPSDEFLKKFPEHTDLIHGRQIGLYKKPVNCSFDHIGVAKLPDLVTFTMNFGHTDTIKSLHGNHPTPVRIAFIPEIIGAGVKKSDPYTTVNAIPCSGVCIMSENSIEYGHPFPVLSDWVNYKFSSNVGQCMLCNEQTSFGMGVCWECYKNRCNGDWKKLLI